MSICMVCDCIINSYWTGGIFEFKFDVPIKYPFEGPKVTCVDKVLHTHASYPFNPHALYDMTWAI